MLKSIQLGAHVAEDRVASVALEAGVLAVDAAVLEVGRRNVVGVIEEQALAVRGPHGDFPGGFVLHEGDHTILDVKKVFRIDVLIIHKNDPVLQIFTIE